MRGRAWLLPALLLAGPVLAGCGDRGDRGDVFRDAPVILISIDTLRSDRLPAYGYGKVETPAIDALGRDAIVYERAYSHYPLTLPSHVSILSGELPPVHGVRDNAGYPFKSADHPFLPRLLDAAGYDTGAAVSAVVLRPDTGLGEGFDFYDGDLRPAPGQSLDEVQRPGAETARVALDWIRERAGKPFFFFLHLYEPHTPFAAPEPFASRYADPYDAEIAAADAVVGEVIAELKRLEIYDRAIVILLSDHGEGLWDHGEGQHGIFLYRETLQVPLMVKLPGGKRGGTRVATAAQLVDVLPTVLAATGLDVPEKLPGTSLLALPPEGDTEPRQIYAETFYPRLHFGWSELTSLIEGSKHYIEAPEPELYDLAADPRETRNLVAAERRAYASLRDAMKGYERALAAPQQVDAETLKKLAALGYAGGSNAVREGPFPDPKTQKHVIKELEDGLLALSEKKHDRVVEIFGRLLRDNPNMQDIWGMYALSLHQLGRAEEAAAAYDRALELSGGSPSLALATAAKLVELGRLDEAEKRAELARAEDPQGTYEMLARIALARRDPAKAMTLMREAVAAGQASETLRRQMAMTLAERGSPGEAVEVLQPVVPEAEPATLNVLGLALSDTGRHAEAVEILQRSAAKDPRNAQALEHLGVVTLRLGRAAEAEGHLRRALELNGRLAGAWNTLGVALYQTQRPGEAVAAWQKAVEIDPRQFEALYNLGLVAAGQGQRAEARRALRQFVATAPPQRFAADIQKAQGILREIGG